MANALYNSYKQSLLDSSCPNLSSDTIKVVLVDTGTYTFSAAHDFFDDVSGTVGSAQTLGSKTITNGVFDAADVTFTSVTGNSAEALIIYKDTGSAATSPLIAYIDSATGLPVTPNSGDINVVWDNGASKIFAI